jgi:hypothetical protein
MGRAGNGRERVSQTTEKKSACHLESFLVDIERLKMLRTFFKRIFSKTSQF